MSWLYSQVLVEEYLGGNFLDGEQSVPLNGSLTQQAYLLPNKMKDFSRLSRFGMMFKPLTENLGMGLLTLYLEGFRVKISVPLEKEKESTENEVQCGSTWRESFARFDLDTHSWRTPQCLLAEDSVEFLGTWPRWGMMLNGECWELEMSEQTTNEIESGLLGKTTQNQLPNPTCHNAKEGAYPSEYTRNTPSLATHAGGKLNPTWVEWMMGWPLGWTDLKPLAMDKSPCAPQQPGEC